MQVPEEKRLQYVTPIVEQIELSSAGELINETWHKGDGFMGGSSYQATLRGAEPFEILRAKIINIPQVTCEKYAPNSYSLNCNQGRVEIGLFVDQENVTNIRILDYYNGDENNNA